jgi:hypothetical protein
MAQSHLSCASGKEGLLCGGSINKVESLLKSAGFFFYQAWLLCPTGIS